MLQLDDPRHPLPPHLLDTAGGFAWWYLDALDAQGDGLVAIGSWGLPFLPGDRAARRAGVPKRTGDRPSMNLVLYRSGRPIWYTLHELRRDEAIMSATTWRFGRTVWALDRAAGRLTLDVDLPSPGTADRLVGSLVVEGPAVVPATVDAHPEHAWTPVLGPAHGRGTLTLGSDALLELDAPAYHDRNGSPTPMDELGIDHWTWGRAILGDTLVVHYLTWSQDTDVPPSLVVVEVDPAGRVTVHDDLRVQLLGRRVTAWGMPWWRTVRIDVDGQMLEVTHDPPVDSGPFYLRATTTTAFRGHVAPGWAELCRPDRIDLDRHRPLIDMAVHRSSGRVSPWSPLFVGRRDDRWRRLWTHWTTGRRPRG